jgi:hypothetical protein
MALSDRALPKALVAVFADPTWTDKIGGLSVTTTAGFDLDPIVSGTSSSKFLAAGVAGSVSATIPALNSLKSFTLEAYVFFPPGATGTVLKIGSTPFIQTNASGYVSITPPYVGATAIDLDYQPFDVTQVSVICEQYGYTIMINGVERYSGSASTAYVSSTSVVFDNDASLSKALGAVFLFDGPARSIDVQRRIQEAVARSDDPFAFYEAETAHIAAPSQVYQTTYDLPIHQPWSDFASYAIGQTSEGIGLKLEKKAVYSQYECYKIDDLGWHTGTSGSVYVRIPSYAASPPAAATRGVIHMRPKFGFGDHHTIKLSSNQLQYVQRKGNYNTSGVDTSAESTPQNIGAALTASADVMVGFVWDSTGLRVVMNGAVVAMTELSSYSFSPFGYELYIGVDEDLLNPYHASQGAWNWELRVWNYADETVGNTDYGTHTFFMGSTASMPVRAEGSMNLEVPIWYKSGAGQEKVKSPTLWYDGYSTVSGVLI